MINRKIPHVYQFNSNFFGVTEVCESYILLQTILFLTDSVFRVLFPYFNASMEYTSNEGKGVHLHTLVDRERKRSNERG